MEILKPNRAVDSISRINLHKYWREGKRGIIIDLDNTLTPWKKQQVNKEAHDFLLNALSHNYKICLLTNAGRKRTKLIADHYNIPFIANAFKPRKKTFLKALKLIGIQNSQAIVIGDQIFTDILGGNRAGCYTILVPALSKRDFMGTKFLRMLEKIFG
jgi:HAD superfamily phosphatase (TIGR01668 family)